MQLDFSIHLATSIPFHSFCQIIIVLVICIYKLQTSHKFCIAPQETRTLLTRIVEQYNFIHGKTEKFEFDIVVDQIGVIDAEAAPLVDEYTWQHFGKRHSRMAYSVIIIEWSRVEKEPIQEYSLRCVRMSCHVVTSTFSSRARACAHTAHTRQDKPIPT